MDHERELILIVNYHLCILLDIIDGEVYNSSWQRYVGMSKDAAVEVASTLMHYKGQPPTLVSLPCNTTDGDDRKVTFDLTKAVLNA